VVLEMNLRDIHFEAIDIYKSDATAFMITDAGIRPPLTALPGLGESAAKAIVEARNEGRFLSVEQLQKRAHVSRAVVDILRHFHCIDDLPDTDQISLFDML
jgi:DNA polymerase-3 subunit alpha (Gram-positive type)